MWGVQILLALLFIYAGVAKLALPAAVLKSATGLSGVFLHVVSVCEICGGLALVLPGWLKIRRGLTPLAAALLIVIMIGAVTVSLRAHEAWPALLLPAVTGLLLAWVVSARLGWAVAER